MRQSHLLELLIKATPASIAVFDTNMCYLMASERWKTDYQLGNRDLIGKSHYDIFPEIPEDWKKIHQECLEGATNKNDEVPFPRIGGSVDYIKWEVRPWYEDDGTIGGIVMFTEVITELVEMKRKLSQQIQVQEMMIQNLPDYSVVMFDHNLRVLLLGGDILRRNGHNREAIEGQLIEDVMPQNTYDILLPYYKRALVGESFFFERRPKHTGQILHSFASPIRDEQGKVIAGIITTQDVTNTEKIRQHLEYTEARFQAIFNNTFQFIGFMDTDGILLEANQTALKFAGIREDDVIGKPFWEAKWWSLSPETQENLKQAIHRAAQGEFIRYDVEVIGKDDAIITIDFSIKPLLDNDGNVVQLIPEGRNITDMVLLQGELQRSNDDLQNFAYVASHDLQEPLRMVTSFLNLLKDEYEGELSEEADQYIDFAVSGAQRMKHLIQDLLEYSRIATQGEQFATVDLNQVIDRVLTDLSLVIQETDARITYTTPMPIIKGDKSQLISLFQNLIGNAIKFQKPDQEPIITIKVTQRGNDWQFAIRDNGIGVDPQYYDRIFTIFKRLHNHSEYEGTGIGLAICKKIVQRHNGKMWLESASEDGSTFYFTLPVALPIKEITI